MSSILKAIFKSTIGLLLTKARDKIAELLKDSDVADLTFRNLVIREIDDMKTKLSGLARKDLLASTEHFRAGILILNQIFEKSVASPTGPNETGEGAAAEAAAVENASVLATAQVTELIHNWQLSDLNESAKESLADATERFKSARKKAIDAFSNEALSTSDRILALKIQLMATILERVDRPVDALDECRLCLQNLHAMPAVSEMFKVQFTEGGKSVFNKKEREAIFVSVYKVNEVVFRVTQIIKGGTFAGKTIRFLCLLVNDELIDVLRDARVVNKLLKLDLAELCVSFWSFDSTFKPWLIATNTRDQTFIVANEINEINVYNPNGSWRYLVKYPNDEGNAEVRAIATDRDGNLYAVLELSERVHVCVWDQHGHFQHSHLLPKGPPQHRSITINDNNQVFVLAEHVTVYNTEGTVVHEFGEGILKSPLDITAASDGRVMVLDMPDDAPPCVHTFSADGDHLQQFTAAPQKRGEYIGSIAFDRSSEAVIILMHNVGGEGDPKVSIYTKDGEFLHEVLVLTEWVGRSVAVTADGRLAVISDKTVRVCIWQDLTVI